MIRITEIQSLTDFQRNAKSTIPTPPCGTRTGVAVGVPLSSRVGVGVRLGVAVGVVVVMVALAATVIVPFIEGWMLQMYPFIHAFPKFLAAESFPAERSVHAQRGRWR